MSWSGVECSWKPTWRSLKDPGKALTTLLITLPVNLHHDVILLRTNCFNLHKDSWLKCVYCLYIRKRVAEESGSWTVKGITGRGGVSGDQDQICVQGQCGQRGSSREWDTLGIGKILRSKVELGQSQHLKSKNWWGEILVCFSLMVVPWDYNMVMVVKERPEGYRKVLLLTETKSDVKLH